jgi:hypothetical protein
MCGFFICIFYYQLPYSQGLLTKADTLAGDLQLGELVGVLLYKNALMRACLVASLCVAGGLLLFRPTRRLGAILTGVFFLVIALIQGFFSQLNEVNVFVLVFGLILIPAFYFISLPDKEKLTKEQLSARSVLDFFRSPGNMLRLGLLAFMAWLFIGFFRLEKKPNVLYGKWKVLHLNRNGDATNFDLWKTDSLAWSKVYIEGQHFIIMNPNPYQYEQRRATERLYTYDSSRHTIIFREGSRDQHPDTVQVTLSGPGQMQWVGK